MKKTIAILFTLSVIGIVNCHSQDSPESIVELFFSTVKDGKYQEAVESLPLSSKLETDTTFVPELKNNLLKNVSTFGEYCGYELINRNDITDSYIILEYLIKYLDAPRRIQFTFYKPKDSWQINQVTAFARERQAGNRTRPARAL